MVSGYFAYQLQTNEMVDGLVVDRQKQKFLHPGRSRWANDQHIPNCRTGHIMQIHLTCVTPNCKIFFYMVNICKNTV